MISVGPQKITDVCTKFHGNPSNSCRDISPSGPKCWTDRPTTDISICRPMLGVWLAKDLLIHWSTDTVSVKQPLINCVVRKNSKQPVSNRRTDKSLTVWSLSTAPSAGSPCDPSVSDPPPSSTSCQDSKHRRVKGRVSVIKHRLRGLLLSVHVPVLLLCVAQQFFQLLYPLSG